MPTHKKDRKIKILGAGPAGLSAAINLAKAGYKVDVFERNSEAGKRFYGDLQGLENWSEKEDILESLKHMNIEINFKCKAFRKTILTNGSKTIKIDYKKPVFYFVKRGGHEGKSGSRFENSGIKKWC